MKANIFNKMAHICFNANIALFLILIVSKLANITVLDNYFFTMFISLFTLTILFICLDQVKEIKIINQKKSQFKSLPRGIYKITDNLTKREIGQLSSNHIDFLREKFLEQHMDDNYFYFLPETLEMFINTEKPNKELSNFLKQAIKDKDDIELFWEKASYHQ